MGEKTLGQIAYDARRYADRMRPWGELDSSDQAGWEDVAQAVVAEHEARANRPDRVSLWFMHDNHTFTRIPATSWEEVRVEAEKLVAGDPSGYFCSATLLQGRREIRRVPAGVVVSVDRSVDEWIQALQADPDVMRLIGDPADEQ